MGLIDEYGQDLVGKVFLWRADFDILLPGDVWFIGKITGHISEDRIRGNSVHWVFYEILLSTHVRGRIGRFYLDSILDKDSVLIDNSIPLEEYLELFSGIKRK